MIKSNANDLVGAHFNGLYAWTVKYGDAKWKPASLNGYDHRNKVAHF